MFADEQCNGVAWYTKPVPQHSIAILQQPSVATRDGFAGVWKDLGVHPPKSNAAAATGRGKVDRADKSRSLDLGSPMIPSWIGQLKRTLLV